jgi:probable HAF family extracellular repeat protein
MQDYPWPFATQQRAALWENGVVKDLGTLGGPSAWAIDINDNGQIIGQSFTGVAEGTPQHVGDWFFSRPMAGFIWENGAMTSLGSLGGTWAMPSRINNHDQVVGSMTLAGDTSAHPFFWEKGVLRDLGTFGGPYGGANAINEAGEVVGGADSASRQYRAFLWRNGEMENLGALGTQSRALAINSKTQIVGASWSNASDNRAFLWDSGGPMLDLNTLVPAGTPRLVDGLGINERGEILCAGADSQGLFLLIPAPQVTVRTAGGATGATIAIDMHVIPGRRYSLQASGDLRTWTMLGTEFIAQTEVVSQEGPAVSSSSEFYRLTVLP